MRKKKRYRFFICYVHDTGGDFARHLKKSFKRRNIPAFLDDEDIPQNCVKKSEWRKCRDDALCNSNTILFVVTEGFEKSPEVKREVFSTFKKGLAVKIFRYEYLTTEIIVKSKNKEINLGKYQQTSFETKEELVRKVLSPYKS